MTATGGWLDVADWAEIKTVAEMVHKENNLLYIGCTHHAYAPSQM